MTTDGTNIRQGGIILIPFPFTDLSGSKKRPALVVSGDQFNKRSEDVICCLITSNPKDRQEAVPITNKDLGSGFLEFDSKVKPYRLFTVDKGVVHKTLGTLNKRKLDEVVSGIHRVIPKA